MRRGNSRAPRTTGHCNTTIRDCRPTGDASGPGTRSIPTRDRSRQDGDNGSRPTRGTGRRQTPNRDPSRTSTDPMRDRPASRCRQTGCYTPTSRGNRVPRPGTSNPSNTSSWPPAQRCSAPGGRRSTEVRGPQARSHAAPWRARRTLPGRSDNPERRWSPGPSVTWPIPRQHHQRGQAGGK